MLLWIYVKEDNRNLGQIYVHITEQISVLSVKRGEDTSDKSRVKLEENLRTAQSAFSKVGEIVRN